MKYLDKSYRLNSDYSPKAKRERLIWSILQAIVFACASFAFFEALCITCNIIGAIVSSAPYQAVAELKRVFPILLNLYGMIAISNSIHAISNPRSVENRMKKILSRGIALIAIGSISLLYVIIGLFLGIYHSIVEGYPTALFPLDLMAMSLVYICMGALLILYRYKWKDKYVSELPCINDTRNPIFRIVDNIFYTIFEMTALFGFAAVIYSTFVVDWIHGHTFFNIMLVLLFITPVLDIALWKYVFLPLKDEYKKKFQRTSSICVLVINILIFALYMLALQLDPGAPNDAAFGILPVEYTASVNASTYIYGLAILVAPISALIKSLIKRK